MVEESYVCGKKGRQYIFTKLTRKGEDGVDGVNVATVVGRRCLAPASIGQCAVGVSPAP